MLLFKQFKTFFNLIILQRIFQKVFTQTKKGLITLYYLNHEKTLNYILFVKSL